jgi:pimeloyl-ACP methyl ester carboxylesterase
MSAGRLSPLRALADDPRFSWCGYLPTRPATRTVVLVHGSDRDPVALIRVFSAWADDRDAALIAPLFPGGVPEPDDLHGYKQALTVDFSFVEIMDAVVADAETRLGAPRAPFDLFGFSGGAQFAHRYALVRPANVRSLVVVAPGNVTLLSPGRRWWAGVDDLRALSGGPAVVEGIRNVPVLAMVGADDDGREVIAVSPDESRWVPGANDAGVTRVERVQTLVSDWRAAGVRVQHLVVPGVAHDVRPFVAAAQSFFDAHAGERRTPHAETE